jgi:hypothetical protein
MREEETRVNFVMNKTQWQVFKMLVDLRHRAYDPEKGVIVNASASDVLRDFVEGYIIDNADLIPQLVAEIRKHDEYAPILKVLETYHSEAQEMKKEQKQ